jgi:FtsZ-binding cell division protein ZapB
MTMDSVLKKLESRIEEFVQTYQKATERIAELESKVAELEAGAGAQTELSDKIESLESQRAEMAERLEKVLGAIDSALED